MMLWNYKRNWLELEWIRMRIKCLCWNDLQSQVVSFYFRKYLFIDLLTSIIEEQGKSSDIEQQRPFGE